MSQRAIEFVEEWVRDHLQPEAFVGTGGDERPGRYAAACLAAAAKKGISPDEINEGIGDLEDYMSEAIDWLAQAEADRLTARDPY